MAGEPVITVVGNLTADPELRYTQSGRPVANGTIAATPRTFDRQSNEWKDGEALFMRFSVWGQDAENVAGSLSKGNRVMAQGRLVQRSYQDREGNDRTSIELQVDEMGPSLKYATAQVTRIAPGSGQQGGQQAAGSPNQAPQGYGPPQGQYGPPQGAQQPPQQQMQQQVPQQQAQQAHAQPQQPPQQMQQPANQDPWAQPAAGFDQTPF